MVKSTAVMELLQPGWWAARSCSWILDRDRSAGKLAGTDRIGHVDTVVQAVQDAAQSAWAQKHCSRDRVGTARTVFVDNAIRPEWRERARLGSILSSIEVGGREHTSPD